MGTAASPEKGPVCRGAKVWLGQAPTTFCCPAFSFYLDFVMVSQSQLGGSWACVLPPWPLDRTKAVGRGGMKPLLPQSERDPQAIHPALQDTSPFRQHP